MKFNSPLVSQDQIDKFLIIQKQYEEAHYPIKTLVYELALKVLKYKELPARSEYYDVASIYVGNSNIQVYLFDYRSHHSSDNELYFNIPLSALLEPATYVETELNKFNQREKIKAEALAFKSAEEQKEIEKRERFEYERLKSKFENL